MWRRQWHPTPVLLPGKSHGRRSLVGCNPWGCKESDTTEQLHFHFSLSCIGEGNGNPLQRSCLENPRDRGAWWAAVYGVTQSQTRLKWLSSKGQWWGLEIWLLKIPPLDFLVIARFTVIKNMKRICTDAGMHTFSFLDKVHNFHHFLKGTTNLPNTKLL